MSPIDDLASSILLNTIPKPDPADNPYTGFANIGDLMSGTIAKNVANFGVNSPSNSRVNNTQNYSVKDDILGSLVSGLLSGTAGNLADSYKTNANNEYISKVTDAISGNKLFNPDNPSGKLFQTIQGIENGNAIKTRNAKIDEDATSAILKNPYQKDEILSIANELKYGKTPTTLPAAEKVTPQIDPGALANAEYNQEATGGKIYASDLLKSGSSVVAPVSNKKTLDDFMVQTHGNETAANALFKAQTEVPLDIEKQGRDALRTTKLASDYTDIQANFNTMKDNYPSNDRPATLAFISSFARVLDPGSTVKEGEIKNAENTQSFLSGLGYKLDSLVNGTQNIGPETKAQMLKAAGFKYNTFGGNYDSFVNQQKTLAANSGGSADRVFGPVTHKPFNYDEWAKGAVQGTSGQSGQNDATNTLSLIAQKANAYKSQGKQFIPSPGEQVIIDMAKKSAGYG